MASNQTDPQPNRDATQVYVVEEDLHGVRLDDYLVQRWPRVDRVFIRNLVLQGGVEVGGDKAGLRHRLQAGDVLVMSLPVPVSKLPRFAPSASDLEIPVLHEDDEVLVVDKPAGVPGVPDRGGKYQGVQGILQATRPDVELRMLARRETDVSGCTLFSKGLEVHKRLEAARGLEVREDYLALVHGVVRHSERRIEGVLGPDTRRPGRVAVVEARSKGGRAAVTTVFLEESFRAHTLVRAVPEAARSHQVRVHLRHLGHPVVADKDYGVADNLLLSEIKRGYKARPGVVERPLLRRMFLHIQRLTWLGPDGQALTVEAGLPGELELVVSKLRSFASRPRN